MRDLTSIELGHVYGAGGCGCSPTPPSCGKGGSKGGSKAHSKPKGGSKAKSKGHSKPKGGSKGHYC